MTRRNSELLILILQHIHQLGMVVLQIGISVSDFSLSTYLSMVLPHTVTLLG